MNDKQITGTIHNWIYDKKQNILIGNLYNDLKDRWYDGARVRTSRVQSEGPFDEGDVVETLNSVYKLGKKGH